MNIKRLALGALGLLAVGCFTASAARADLLPFDVTVYGLYGAPTEPNAFAQSNADGLGFGGLFEWNPSYFASLGLSYEQTGFYGNSHFAAGTLNLEGKYYLGAFIRDFSPYFSAGAGFNLFTPKTGWPGGAGLKIGFGNKLPFLGPTLLDVGFNYHWMTDPGAFQYADLHMGVGYAFDITPPPAQAPQPTPAESAPKAKPTAVMTASPMETPAATATGTPTPTVGTPVATATVTATATESMGTPTPEISAAMEPTPSATEVAVVSKMKKYYHAGVRAFAKRQYKSAIADFNLCVAIKDPVVPSFYYAEAYSTLGVIYQFHKTTPGHLDTARKYYKKALKIDPQTETAKKYLAKLGPEKAAVKVKKKKTAAAPTPFAEASPSISAASVAPAASPEPVASPAAVSGTPVAGK
ncbi:MAG TPA: hypothetical protein VMU88_02905 [bacterium]|nr:hypothetical protein [bacterium]